MNDQYFESEIKALRSGLVEYKQARKAFNNKIAEIQHPTQKVQDCIKQTHKLNPSLTDNELIRECDKKLENQTQSQLNKSRGADKLTEYNKNIPNKTDYNQPDQNKIDLSYYGDDTATALVNCRNEQQRNGLSVQDATNFCNSLPQIEGADGVQEDDDTIKVGKLSIKQRQELAARHGTGADVILVSETGTSGRTACVQKIEEIPSWVKVHDYVFNKPEANHIEESDQPKIKSATVEDNRPAFMKTRSNLVETMGLHREESNNQETVEPVIAIKSASVENTIVELPGAIKRIQNKFGRDQ